MKSKVCDIRADMPVSVAIWRFMGSVESSHGRAWLCVACVGRLPNSQAITSSLWGHPSYGRPFALPYKNRETLHRQELLPRVLRRLRERPD